MNERPPLLQPGAQSAAADLMNARPATDCISCGMTCSAKRAPDRRFGKTASCGESKPRKDAVASRHGTDTRSACLKLFGSLGWEFRMIRALSKIVPIAALLMSVAGANALQLTVYTALESDLLPVCECSTSDGRFPFSMPCAMLGG